MIKVVNLLSLILAPMLTVYKFGADMTINLALLAALAVMTMITIWAIRKSTKPADFGMESAKVEAVQ
ncbi:MAG: hypothetical protein AM326_09735 [Candidatus Thorarchaeota archaeon SMTZ-45]|nr:MAG: hypothetical protein AM326_09735 [Candidatus Thorarchaeota archaeon SMTZ-45]